MLARRPRIYRMEVVVCARLQIVALQALAATGGPPWGPSCSLRLSTLRPHFPFGPCSVANVNGLQLLPGLSLSCDNPRKTQAFPNTASSSPGFFSAPRPW